MPVADAPWRRSRHTAARLVPTAIGITACATACATACGNGSGSEFDASPCGPTHGTIATVLDGDTVELESGERIRYLLVNTPELSSNDCWATEAANFNAQLVAGRDVHLAYDDDCTDPYGRLLAYVTVDGRNVNALLVERGYACVLYLPPSGGEREEEFAELESAARRKALGMWGACARVTCG